MSEHPSLILTDNNKQEAEAIAKELLEKVQPIIESRRKLKEAQEEITVFQNTLLQIQSKLENLESLKSANLQLEREVLEKLKSRL